MDYNDIEFLVQETLNFDHSESSKSPFDNESFWIGDEFEVEKKETEVSISNGAGVLFTIKRGDSTFAIQTLPSENMANDYSNIIEDNEGKLISDIYSFETEYYELSEIIHDQVIYKRFPVNEETFGNLGDPGLSWWLQCSENSLSLFFNKSYLPDGGDVIKLGPIGDTNVSKVRFQQAEEIFKKILPVSHIYCSENKFHMEISDSNNEMLEKIKFALINGNLDYVKALSIKEYDQELDMFFVELVSVRKFWIYVEKLLRQNIA